MTLCLGFRIGAQAVGVSHTELTETTWSPLSLIEIWVEGDAPSAPVAWVYGIENESCRRRGSVHVPSAPTERRPPCQIVILVIFL